MNKIEIKHTCQLDNIRDEDFFPIDAIGISEEGELIHGTITRRMVYQYELTQYCPTEYDSYDLPDSKLNIDFFIYGDDLKKILQEKINKNK